MEQELQSNLLRLSILIATSLSTLLEPVEPTIVSDPSNSKEAAQNNVDGRVQLNKQILQDLRHLFTAVQQACTNLSLALRPTKKSTVDVTESSYVSPIAGLDSPSLEAANAQLSAIANDHVPKLVFLARKAQSEATLHKYVAKTEDDLKREADELKMIKARNGHVVRPAFARDTEKLERMKGKGLGRIWSKSIVSSVFELLDALGQVSQAYMDHRTRTVLQKASAARDKADGRVATATIEEKPQVRSTEEARQRALQATGVVWGVCDTALKGKEKLIENNREATRISWRIRTGVLKDGLREFDDSTKLEENGSIGNDAGGDGDEEKDADGDPLDDLADLSLSRAQKEDAKRYLPLLRAACLVHAQVADLYLSSRTNVAETAIDYDDLDAAGERIAETLDELISSVLYGDSFDETEDQVDGDDDEEKELDEAVKDLVEASEALCSAATIDGTNTMPDQLTEALTKVREAAADVRMS